MFVEKVAAVSLGIFNHEVFLDLDYNEDSSCEADINIVMTSNGEIVEIHGTAEKKPFSEKLLFSALKDVKNALEKVFYIQKMMIENPDMKSINSRKLK